MCDIVSGWYKAEIKNEFQKEIADIFCPPIEKINKKTFLPSSRSIAFKKELWKKVNGYPENTYTAEDTLFDKRIIKYSKNLVFNENAFVYWKIPKDNDELKKKLFQYGYGEGQQKLFLLKNFAKIALLLFPPILIFTVIFRIKNKNVFKFYYYFSLGFLKGLFN